MPSLLATTQRATRHTLAGRRCALDPTSLPCHVCFSHPRRDLRASHPRQDLRASRPRRDLHARIISAPGLAQATATRISISCTPAVLRPRSPCAATLSPSAPAPSRAARRAGQRHQRLRPCSRCAAIGLRWSWSELAPGTIRSSTATSTPKPTSTTSSPRSDMVPRSRSHLRSLWASRSHLRSLWASPIRTMRSRPPAAVQRSARTNGRAFIKGATLGASSGCAQLEAKSRLCSRCRWKDGRPRRSLACCGRDSE